MRLRCAFLQDAAVDLDLLVCNAKLRGKKKKKGFKLDCKCGAFLCSVAYDLCTFEQVLLLPEAPAPGGGGGCVGCH